MHIHIENAGKKFNGRWIFRHVNKELLAGKCYAITGTNGSGKSTFVQALSGFQTLSEGEIHLSLSGQEADMHTRYKQLSLCAVYTELPEELTLHELYHFHTSFKPLRNNLTAEAFAQYCGIAHTHDLQQIKLFSSGMKQRIKLGLAFLEQTELLLLDEPCSNLDKNGISWYRQELIAAKEMGRTIVIASNQEYEYPIADEVIDLERYKV